MPRRRYGAPGAYFYPPIKHSRRGTPRPDPALTRTPTMCAGEYDRLFTLFTEHNCSPRVLLGWNAVLHYLNDVLCIRNQWGARLTRKMVETWIAQYGFPILHGIKTPRATYTCVTIERCIDAWILSRPRNGVRELFAFVTDANGELGNWGVARKTKTHRPRAPYPPSSPAR